MLRAAIAFGSGVFSLVAQATFQTTIGLGSILVAALVVVMAGVFNFRDRRNSGWKDLYEQEREKTSNLVDEKEQERVVRHGIKDDLAATRAQLEIEKAKPDLSIIIERQQTLWAESTGQVTTLLGSMQETQLEMLGLLREIKGGTR